MDGRQLDYLARRLDTLIALQAMTLEFMVLQSQQRGDFPEDILSYARRIRVAAEMTWKRGPTE